MYKRILVPLDGSVLAETVLPYVRELAKCTGAEIILLRVTSVPAYAYLPGDPRMVDYARESALEEGASYLQNLKAGLVADGFKVSAEHHEGMVAETIQDVAASTRADLIAMSTHGRSGLARLVMGSVADQVLRSSHVPVFLVRPAQHRQVFIHCASWRDRAEIVTNGSRRR